MKKNKTKKSKVHLGGYIPGGDKETWFPKLWKWAVKELKIKSVLDIGCGEGHSTKFFYDNGCEVLGIEGSTQAIKDSPIANKITCHDFCDGPYIPDKKYDLIWCCEFVEHVDKKYMKNFIQTFKYGKYLFLTHATPGQGGYHHVNEQPLTYWLKHIKKSGFIFLPELTLIAREKSINGFFLRSGLIFKNRYKK